MTTTDEMREKLGMENEELTAKISEIEETIKPLRKQLDMNKEVLAIINKRLGQDKPKRKYTKKKKDAE